jgi:hypothetical protein
MLTKTAAGCRVREEQDERGRDMRVIIDRFEEDKAVIEADGEMLTVPRALFGDAQEGDHVEITVLGKPHQSEKDDLVDDSETEVDPLISHPIEEVSGFSDASLNIPCNAEADDPSFEADPHSIFERLRAKRRQKS